MEQFIIDLKPYEAILLAGIIAVSILIIENIFYINNKVLDPLNCDQCKINNTDHPIKLIVPNPLENNQLNSNTMGTKDNMDNVKDNIDNVTNDNVENFDSFGATILNRIQQKSKELANNISSTINNTIPLEPKP